MARLRRGLGKPYGHAPDRDRWVLQNMPRFRQEADHLYDRRVAAGCLVASLFAAAKADGPGRGTLGAAFREIPDRQDGDSTEKRFVALLDADADDLPSRLQHAVTLLAARGVHPDWARLLADILAWDHPNRRVQRDWARDFWAARPTDQEDEPEPAMTGDDKPSSIQETSP
ncbi:MAG TPA: type I-E CRISPR-associated protein Cse2/CasB [Fimbriiglobus sp.]|nr:type I-E CRISPR-associated protein Cse2/CasB [Fimbriiglobus sp.]